MLLGADVRQNVSSVPVLLPLLFGVGAHQSVLHAPELRNVPVEKVVVNVSVRSRLVVASVHSPPDLQRSLLKALKLETLALLNSC